LNSIIIYILKFKLVRMREINLLNCFSKIKRNIEPSWRKKENKVIAKRYDKEFFDGDRVNGYGGYYYDGRWKGVVKNIQEIYKINSESSVLDIGCAKGFLLYDLQDMIPGIKIAGIDISEYAINHAMGGYNKYLINEGERKKHAKNLEEIARSKVLPHMIIGNAEKLPWADNTFDLVLSINTSHNLPKPKLIRAIKEMNRVCKPGGYKFIQVDAWRNQTEKDRMMLWALTAETMMSNTDWLNFFKKNNYDGDYFWTIV